MKTFKLLSVKLINLETFKNFDGTEQFEAEFSEYAESGSLYKFFNASDMERAENLLNVLNLKYDKYYGSEVESDEDMMAHPIFYIIFSANHKTVVKEGETFFVNSKKMGKKNFQKDMDEDLLILTKKGMEFFKAEIPEIEFEKILDITKKTEYYKVVNFFESAFPIIYKKEFYLEESQVFKGTYSITPDGRANLDDRAINEIRNNKLVTFKTFEIGDQVYPSTFALTLISGEFALKIKQNFNLEKESICINPLVTDIMDVS